MGGSKGHRISFYLYRCVQHGLLQWCFIQARGVLVLQVYRVQGSQVVLGSPVPRLKKD